MTRIRREGRAIGPVLSVCLVGWLTCQGPTAASAQTPPAAPVASTELRSPSNTFEGRYDAGDVPLYLVADGEALSVVIAGAVYPLAREADGRVRNAAGQLVDFERGPDGSIVAASDGNGRYAFVSREVPDRVRAYLRPAPEGAVWTYSIPPATDRDLVPADAVTVGLGHEGLEALVSRLTTDPAWAGVHSLLIYRRDRLVMEAYFYGYTQDEPHDLRSATKSVHAALAGIAVEQGLLNLDTPVWRALADRRGAHVDDGAARISLGQILNMQTGLACDDFEPGSPARELEMMRSPDWVGFMLAAPVAPVEPGVGHYCSGAPVAVGHLIESLTGQGLADVADEQLFSPLGIRRSRWSWDFSPRWQGDTHVAGLFMTPRDMVRFGRLYLDEGAIEGRQLLPVGWVRETFDAPVRVGSWRRYGRFWWTLPVTDDVLGPARTFTVHAAMGNGGQVIAVAPEYEAVIVLTGGNFNDDTPTTRILGWILRSMADDPSVSREPDVAAASDVSEGPASSPGPARRGARSTR